MRAVQIFHDEFTDSDGSIIEMMIWQVPVSVEGSAHDLKYRLFYGYPGRRVIGYDNERGKGDHRHREGQEEPYAFTTVDRLIEDFLADVAQAKKEEAGDE